MAINLLLLRKLTSLRGTGASALPPLTIFHSLSALQRWLHCTQHRHRCQRTQHPCHRSTTNNVLTTHAHVLGFSCSPSLDAGVARFIINTLKTRLPKSSAEGLLTERQMEILTLLGEGLLKKEIAERLTISYATVDEHVAHIYARLGVRNAPAAVNQAHLLGLFPPARPRSR